MKRNRVLYFVDLLLLISTIICCITGLLKWKELQSFLGFAPDRPQGLGGLNQTHPVGVGVHAGSQDILTFLHDWSGVIMIALIIIHLILHWRWIVIMTRGLMVRKKTE